MDNSLIIYAIAGLAFLTIVGVGLALTGDSADAAAKKRAKAIGTGGSGAGKRGKAMDETAKRRQKTQEMLDNMRKQDKERRKAIRPQNLKSRLTQAGLDIPVAAFWMLSLVLGLLIGGLVYTLGFDGLVIGGVSLKSRPILVGSAFFVGAVGLPRMILNFMTNGRNKKMINQFADALDIIVRGVKSGLPLNESVRIISRESPEPLRTEFAMLSDNLAMGAGLERSLNTFYKRVPLQEVNFFMIVLMIQSKAGGNLSEALGNLSSVIRARKMMREKVKAMSSEAKASAMIIGALPFVVGFLVYMPTPAYVMQLFTTDTGHLFLTIGVVMMMMGVAVMRKMINFDM